LLQLLKLPRWSIGPNGVWCYVYENQNVALVIPEASVKFSTTKVTLAVLLVRLLFGKNRASEPATPTEVWVVSRSATNSHHDLAHQAWRPGVEVQVRVHPEVFEVRRAPWLRLLGPIEVQEKEVTKGWRHAHIPV
jgi:hypothetical protein